MNTHYPTLRKPFSVETVDRLTAALVGVMAFVQVAAVWVAHYTLGTSTVATGGATPIAGVSLLTAPLIAGVAVVEALIIILVWRWWQLLPDWLRRYGAHVLLGGVIGIGIWYVGVTYGWVVAALAIGATGAHAVFSYVDLDWMTHNALAAGLGISIAAFVGAQLTPGIVIVILALLMIWDHVAVFVTDWMFELSGWAGRARLPVYLIFPTNLRFDHDALEDYIHDPRKHERPEHLGAVLGLGDVTLPTLLTVSAVVSLPGSVPLPAVGAAIGAMFALVKLRSDMDSYNSGVPALPWVASGAIIGYATGIILAGIPLGSALGVA